MEVRMQDNGLTIYISSSQWISVPWWKLFRVGSTTHDMYFILGTTIKISQPVKVTGTLSSNRTVNSVRQFEIGEGETSFTLVAARYFRMRHVLSD